MILNFNEFIEGMLKEGRKSNLTSEEKIERDELFKLGKKRRTEEQEKRYLELLQKTSSKNTDIIENSPIEDIKPLYDLDDYIDYTKIDLKGEYEKMSKLLYDKGIFKELLMNIPITLVKRKNENAFVSFINNVPTKLSFSTLYKTKYVNFLGTLAHECIHIYQSQKKLGLKEQHHGPTFMYFMELINNAGFPFKVYIRDASVKEFSDNKKTENIILLINSKNESKSGFLVLNNLKVWEEFKTFENIVNRFTKAFNLKNIEVYKTTNPFFAKQKSSRVINSYYIFSDNSSKVDFFNQLKIDSEHIETLNLETPYKLPVGVEAKVPSNKVIVLEWNNNIGHSFSIYRNNKIETINTNMLLLKKFSKNLKDLNDSETYRIYVNVELPKSINKFSKDMPKMSYSEKFYKEDYLKIQSYLKDKSYKSFKI